MNQSVIAMAWRANNGSRGSTNKQINQSARRAYASFRQDHDDRSGEEDACGRVGISAVMYVVGTNLLRAGWVSVLLPAHAEWFCLKAGTLRASDNELYARMLPSPDSSDSDTTFLFTLRRQAQRWPPKWLHWRRSCSWHRAFDIFRPHLLLERKVQAPASILCTSAAVRRSRSISPWAPRTLPWVWNVLQRNRRPPQWPCRWELTTFLDLWLLHQSHLRWIYQVHPWYRHWPSWALALDPRAFSWLRPTFPSPLRQDSTYLRWSSPSLPSPVSSRQRSCQGKR